MDSKTCGTLMTEVEMFMNNAFGKVRHIPGRFMVPVTACNHLPTVPEESMGR